MPRSNPYTPSFNAGELTPRLAARTGFAKFPAGLETCVNIIPLAEGGLMRRSGTRFVAELKDSSVLGRLKRFEFSTTQAYVLELGQKIMRFYRFQGQIIVPATDAVIADGDFPGSIAAWTDVSTGTGSIALDATNNRLNLIPGGATAPDIGWAEQSVSVGAAFDTNEHVLKFRVLGAPSDRIELNIGTTTGGTEIVDTVQFEVGYHAHAFTPGDGNNTIFVQFRNLGSFRNKTVQIDDVSLIDDDAVEIDTPWPEGDLFFVNGPQSADTLYLYHPSHPTYKLLRFGNTSWSLVEVAWIDGPYLLQNATTTTLLPSAATGLGITLTLSSIVGVNDDKGWQATDIGRLVRYQKAGAGAWGYAIITAITSTTIAVADVREDFQATPTAATAFRLGAWSSTTGYAALGAFYEQRQFAATTTFQPQTFWATQTADFENHTPDNRDTTNDGTVEDDDALDYTISADEVETIRWLSPGEDTLAIGATSGEWIPDSTGIVLTPSDIVVRRRTKHGSANIQPARVGNVVLFVQRAKRKIREFGFAFEVDGFRAPNMTRLAQHVTLSTIVEMAYQQEPDSLLWAIRADGTLISMTYRREEDVVGWARHDLGGGGSTGASSSFEITGGTAATGNQITSITVGGEELMARPLDFVTDTDGTATALVSQATTLDVGSNTTPEPAYITFTNSDPEGSFASVTVTTSASVAVGDLLIAQIGRSGIEGQNISADDSAWIPIFENKFSEDGPLCQVDSARLGTTMSMFRLKATVAGATAYTFSYTVANSQHAIGAIIGIRKAHPTVPIGDHVESISTPCNSPVGFRIEEAYPNPGRSIQISRATAVIENTMHMITVAAGETFMTAGSPLSPDNLKWSKQLDQFKGPIPQSLHLQLHTRAPIGGSSLEAGTYDAVTHDNLDRNTNLDALGIVISSLSISPDYETVPPPLIDNSGGNYTVGVSGSVVTITANNADFGEGGEEVVVTTAGNVTVSPSTSFMVPTGIAVSESVVTIPGANGAGQVQSSEDRDEVWVTVRRTINGIAKRYIEVFERDYEDGDDAEDSYYADSCITYDGVAASVITGLDHVEDATVKVWADGFVHPDKVVAGGAITLDNPAKVVQIGLPFAHTIKPLRFEGGTAVGTAVGKTKQVFGVTFVMLNSHTLSFGPDADNLRDVDFRQITSAMDAAVPLFTGEFFEEFDDDWKTDPRIVIQSDDPAPFTLLALAPENDTRELK